MITDIVRSYGKAVKDKDFTGIARNPYFSIISLIINKPYLIDLTLLE